MWWRPSPENRFRRGKYMDWFACLDRDGNGVIDHGDLQSYGRRITEALSIDGDAMSMARLRAATSMLWTSLIGSMDESGEGTIQLDELVGAMITAEGQLRSRGEIPEWAKDYAMCLFRVLDVDGTETISLEEYRAYLAAIGSDADAADAFATLDTNGDGVLSLDEIEAHFATWLGSGQPEEPGNVLMTGRLPIR